MGQWPHAMASPFNILTSLSLGLVVRRDFLENDSQNFVAKRGRDQNEMSIVAIGCHTQQSRSEASRFTRRKYQWTLDPTQFLFDDGGVLSLICTLRGKRAYDQFKA